MDSKNIVIFSEDFPPYSGGIAQWSAGVAESLCKQGHSVIVVTRYRGDYKLSKEELPSYPIRYIHGKNWRKFRTWYCYKELKRLYDSGNEIDIIIGTTWNFARGLVGLAKKNNSKLITIVHGLEVTRKMSKLKQIWLRKTLKSSYKVIAVSKFTRQNTISRFNLPLDKVFVLPNGVNTKKFYKSDFPNYLKKRYSINNEKIILTLARVIERKGHDNVIESFPKVLDKIPNLKYVICGPWEVEYYKKLNILIDKLNLKDYVIFTDYVSLNELNDFYNLCDVYIMPSRELTKEGDVEGFGITYLEANACEKPVIGGKSGGVEDAIVDGETGLLVDPLNIDDIAEKLIKILNDNKFAQKLGDQGKKRIDEAFTWDAITKNLIEIIVN